MVNVVPGKNKRFSLFQDPCHLIFCGELSKTRDIWLRMKCSQHTHISLASKYSFSIADWNLEGGRKHEISTAAFGRSKAWRGHGPFGSTTGFHRSSFPCVFLYYSQDTVLLWPLFNKNHVVTCNNFDLHFENHDKTRILNIKFHVLKLNKIDLCDSLNYFFR